MCSPGVADGHEADEHRLLEAARAGDERALGVLLDRHRSGLEQCCYLMLGDRCKARSAISETALAAWNARSGADPASSARMWLYRIALGVCAEAERGER
jgi:RNA polymerase sigma-70 factor, ECF subfamily